MSMSVRDLAAATAGKTPIPGGGSIAGVVGALGTALGEMVLSFTRGKKKYAAHAEAHRALAERLARARGMFADLTSDDASAYLLYQEATRADEAERPARLAAASAAAINVPREMTALAISVLEALVELGAACNKHLLTDLAASAYLAEAVVRLSDLNVRVNAAGLADPDQAAQLREVSTRDCGRAAGLREQVERIVGENL
jgi:formiminotetrahydrofolate cyclodeaminase